MTARAVLGETKEGKVMPMTRKRDPYAPLPLTIMAHTTLSMGARVCYAALRHFARDEATCFPSLAALAASIGSSERMTRRYVDDLEEAGAVTVQRRGQGHSNLYTLCDTPPTHQARHHYRKDLSGLERPDVSHLDRTDMATHTSAVPAPMAALDRTDMATPLNKEGLEAIKKSTTTPDGVGAAAPPAAQVHEPRAHDAPTEDSLPPARTAAAGSKQQEPESSPGLVFEGEDVSPNSATPPRRQSSRAAAAPKALSPTVTVAETWMRANKIDPAEAEGSIIRDYRTWTKHRLVDLGHDPELLQRCLRYIASKRENDGAQFTITPRVLTQRWGEWLDLPGKPDTYTPPPARQNGNGYSRARGPAPPAPEVQAERAARDEARRQKSIEKYGHDGWW